MKRLKELQKMRPVRRSDQGADALSAELMSFSGENSSWAVAYADLLMVLMSFFVIFSSLGTETAKDNLYQIAMSLTNRTQKASGSGSGIGPGAGPETSNVIQTARESTSPLTFPANVFAKLSQDHIHYLEDGKSILISFEGDQFGSGSFELSLDVKRQLDEISKALSPYIPEVEILVIGHADSRAMGKHGNIYLRDNFDLSSFRALEATRYFASHGVPTNHLRSQASSDNELSQRSLSIRISAFRGHEK